MFCFLLQNFQGRRGMPERDLQAHRTEGDDQAGSSGPVQLQAEEPARRQAA